jgi:hypothetical protein
MKEEIKIMTDINEKARDNYVRFRTTGSKAFLLEAIRLKEQEIMMVNAHYKTEEYRNSLAKPFTETLNEWKSEL